MTDYTPPLATGLQGDYNSPEKQLEPFIEDLSDARSPGAYVAQS